MRWIPTIMRGLRIAHGSAKTVRYSPELLVYPLTTAVGLALLYYVGVSVVSELVVTLFEGLLSFDTMVLLSYGILYFSAAAIFGFCNAALIHQATRVMDGYMPSVYDGFAAAWSTKRKILIWCLVSTTVGVVLYFLRGRGNGGQRVLGSLLGASWSVISFFVFPVMLFTDEDGLDMFKQSLTTFKSIWGESLSADLGVDLVFGALAVVLSSGVITAQLIFPSVFGYTSASAISLPIAIVLAIRMLVMGFVRAALYQYATDGSLPVNFRETDVAPVRDEVGQSRLNVEGQTE